MSALHVDLEQLGYRLGLGIARGVHRGLAVASPAIRKASAATLRPRTLKRRSASRRVKRADVSTPKASPTAEFAAVIDTITESGKRTKPAPFAMIGFDEPAAAQPVEADTPPKTTLKNSPSSACASDSERPMSTEEAEALDVLGSDVDEFLDDDEPAGESFADKLRREVQADAAKERATEKEENRKRRGFVGAVERIREVAL